MKTAAVKKKPIPWPGHLSEDARRLGEALTYEYPSLADDAAGRALLITALEARDRAESCRARIDADGELLPDRFGQMKPHPLLSAERDSRGVFLRAVAALQLDVVPTSNIIGRPGGKVGV